MSIFHSPKKPEDVFTPRASSVNEAMYVPRPDLETALGSGLRSGLHLLIHGQSGSGKTWLYKSVLAEKNVYVMTANLANASRLGSISAELKNLVERKRQAKKTGYSETKSASLSVGVASGDLEHEGIFEYGEMEPFEACLDLIRAEAGKKRAVLVLDNLESARSNSDLLKELADIITLVDDERYAKYKVTILVVGVPGDLREYFQETPNLATVANRLRELPEVTRLTPSQCEALIKRGFVDELRYSSTPDLLRKIVEHVTWVTDGLPQRVHEYCLELAFVGERAGRVLHVDHLAEVDPLWLGQSLQSNYTVIEGMMNERETKIGRRNQTLYALGRTISDEFRWSEIEAIVRREFPASTAERTLNMSQILSGLADQERAIIKRSPKGDAYCFSDPKYRMCLRVMLRKRDGADAVEKISASNV